MAGSRLPSLAVPDDLMPISFLSDYGSKDEFVGVVHGVVVRIEPRARVLDIGHRVRPGDVRGGALMLMRAIQYLPNGVALAIVDPGVGTDRRAIAAQTPWGHFVGPDNGLLAPAVAMVGGAEKVVRLDNPQFRLPAAGPTFDGRDVFAPAAAVLAGGQAELDDLGSAIDPSSLTPLLLPLVDDADGALRGEAWWIDGFGNVQTNIGPDDLQGLGLVAGETVEVVVGGTTYPLTWARAFGEVEPGEGLVFVDSYGLVALAVREGRAEEDFGLTEGMAVVFRGPT